jgi:hypothetical protein
LIIISTVISHIDKFKTDYDLNSNFSSLAFFPAPGQTIIRHTLPVAADNTYRMAACGYLGSSIASKCTGRKKE